MGELVSRRAPKATAAPKYLYHALGSRLFAAIVELPEYNLTRAEAAISSRHLGAMAGALGPVVTLVDKGAGNCGKAARLFDVFQGRRYVAVDISASYLRDSLEKLQRQYPQMDMLGIGLDFSADLNLPAEVGEGARTLFYPGTEHEQFLPSCVDIGFEQSQGARASVAHRCGENLAAPAARGDRRVQGYGRDRTHG